MSYLSRILFLSLFFTVSCSIFKPSISSKNQKLEQIILNDTLMSKHFVGFSLFDPGNQKTLVDINGDKLFTPASNIKILTFLAALKILKDSVPVIRYHLTGKDSLVFKGTGYPLTLNPEIGNDTSLIYFLKTRKEKIFYCDHNEIEKYGSGWAWDDAIYYYQREIDPLPLFGNVIDIKKTANSYHINPSIFTEKLIVSSDQTSFNVETDQYNINNTELNHTLVPIRNYNKLMPSLLSEKIKKPIYTCPESRLSDYDQALSVPLNDSLYIRLMHQSDNFIAEQLLLLCGDSVSDTLETKQIIEYVLNNILETKDPTIRWVDGSGLSRYNLLSPNLIIEVLNKILKHIGVQNIKTFFPAGGISGTLQNNYHSDHAPFVFAKTGSLGNNHNISGYLITKKNNFLLFSFMNNHFLGSNNKVKKQMEKILNHIYMTY